MPSATVTGAHGQTVTLNFDSNANAALASRLAAAITAGVQNGSIIPAVDTDGPPPALPPGKTGEFVQTQTGSTILPHGYKAFVDTAPNSIVFGSGGKDETVLSSTGNLDFIATGGSGTVVAGGGNNVISIPQGDKGDWSINTGNGNDNVLASGGGDDTISAGGGHNRLELGTGKDFITSLGNDIIVGSTGQETVAAFGDSSDYVVGNASNLFFVGNGGSATIFGGTGSDTVLGGSGPDYVVGGTAGHNLLMGGAGTATLIGGGDGDVLKAGLGSPGQALRAGLGNETLEGGHGSDTLYGGGKGSSTQIIGGKGNDTFVSAGGIATVTAAASSSLFAFVKSDPGGSSVINGFISGVDQIGLEGFKPNEAKHALNSQNVVNGNDTITLSDHTKITFVGVTNLSESDFTTIKQNMTPQS